MAMKTAIVATNSYNRMFEPLFTDYENPDFNSYYIGWPRRSFRAVVTHAAGSSLGFHEESGVAASTLDVIG